jgi:ribonuclease HI
MESSNPILVDLPDMHILQAEKITWKIYFDGYYRHHGSGAGILFIMPLGVTIPKSYKLLFPCTNNVAKYEALVLGLKLALELKLTALEVYGDSQLIINQDTNVYQTKDDKLFPYKHIVDALKAGFVHITFKKIPREKNRVGDA